MKRRGGGGGLRILQHVFSWERNVDRTLAPHPRTHKHILLPHVDITARHAYVCVCAVAWQKLGSLTRNRAVSQAWTYRNYETPPPPLVYVAEILACSPLTFIKLYFWFIPKVKCGIVDHTLIFRCIVIIILSFIYRTRYLLFFGFSKTSERSRKL